MALTSKPLKEVRPSVPVELVTSSELVRVNLNVPEDMRQRWKKASIDRKMTMAELITAAVEDYLSK